MKEKFRNLPLRNGVGIAVLNKEAFITWVWLNDKYTIELNRPTLVNPKRRSKGKLLKIFFFNIKISLKVNGNKINHTVNHLKNTNVIGGIFSKKANFPIIKFPAQNNVAHTNII